MYIPFQFCSRKSYLWVVIFLPLTNLVEVDELLMLAPGIPPIDELNVWMLPENPLVAPPSWNNPAPKGAIPKLPKAPNPPPKGDIIPPPKKGSVWSWNGCKAVVASCGWTCGLRWRWWWWWWCRRGWRCMPWTPSNILNAVCTLTMRDSSLKSKGHQNTLTVHYVLKRIRAAEEISENVEGIAEHEVRKAEDAVKLVDSFKISLVAMSTPCPGSGWLAIQAFTSVLVISTSFLLWKY